MTRGLGWFDAFREVVPEWAVVVLGLVTQLGDVWFLGVLVGTLYWIETDDRDDIAAVAGLLLAGLSLITALKHVFALPRPERVLVEVEALPAAVHPLYEATATATGYGFPSGHALMSTIVYLSLAEYSDVSTRRRRFLGAAGLVTAVSLSRVGLGVHYLVDVVAGVAVGLVFLLLAWGLLNRYPTHRGTIGFGLAVGIAAAALVTSSMDPDAVLLFGASLGAFAGWQLALLARGLDAGQGPIRADRRLTVRAVAAGFVIVSLVGAIAYYWPVSLLAGSGALGVAVAALVPVPELYRTERVRRLRQRSLSGSQ
ncbi:phosphatase PAP2 family protein [Natrinema ejinorense]|uniref:Phosphoesterase PA-phosphatase n=1 Tax=Natrinema ejinorense TaxID=373386 RepID=A0A2A5QQT3_9EURY|nr:phosphatase PAP2 family protein [Natrinema ejinorense]PCR89197.1 phosphoesterase PA-phosphatase [Natrinema ejinorense]